MGRDNETPAHRFQGAMMANDWLCDSTVGHEVGTCLGCITVALAATGLEARVAQLEGALRDTARCVGPGEVYDRALAALSQDPR